ncbi:hypothetical protein [Streptomyces sp. NBC_00887]|uniref:hypothetical protein n=1 Tax=Streptomyces sp. NBC_00887 TaxID=2975859 RepID=UPI0038666134|nr:hypothetical protein OG844_43965 [Streptomyces sp. NBC_00887]WSY36862.1 hypothetical protein OG844_01635 [Streptomyces sp. NBC_00887]
MQAQQARTLTRLLFGSGAVLMAAALPTTAVHADETHTHSHNAPHLSLIQTGQIDDPLEDVLEHPTILGTTHVSD